MKTFKKIDFQKGSGIFVLGYMMMIVCLFIGLVLIEQNSRYENALNTQIATDSISDGTAIYASTLRGMDKDEMYTEAKDKAKEIAELIADNTSVKTIKEYDIHENTFKDENMVSIYLTANYEESSNVKAWGIDDGTDEESYNITRYATTSFTNGSSDNLWPLTTTLMTSPFGWRIPPVTSMGYGSNNHGGLDIAGSVGQPIYAVNDGTVEFYPNCGSAGNMIQQTLETGTVIKYMHCDGFNSLLSNGSSVKKGDLIGYVGNTGNSGGPHLHLQAEISGMKYNCFYTLYNGMLDNLELPNNGNGSIANPNLVNSYGTGLLDYEYFDGTHMIKKDGTVTSYGQH